MTNKGTVKFNVGGTRYEVARSLLEAHPDVMITRMISEEWQQSNADNGEVYIERDGARFKYLLDYLRDGKVALPLNVSKKAVIDDLKYYGVDPEDRINYDNVEVPDVNSLFLNTMTSSEKALGNLVEEEHGLSEEIEQAERTLQELKDQKKDVCNRIQVFRAARVIYESIITEVINCNPSPGFPSSLSIDFTWRNTGKDKDKHLNFLVDNQADYFDFLKLYLDSSFGVEVVCISVNSLGSYTRQLLVEFLVKSGKNVDE